MKRLAYIATVGLVLCGCSIFKQPTPTTTVCVEMAGRKLHISNPKQTIVTNLLWTIETQRNNVVKETLSMGYLSSVNDSNILSAGYNGEAALATALGTQIVSGVNAGANLAEKAAVDAALATKKDK